MIRKKSTKGPSWRARLANNDRRHSEDSERQMEPTEAQSCKVCGRTFQMPELLELHLFTHNMKSKSTTLSSYVAAKSSEDDKADSGLSKSDNEIQSSSAVVTSQASSSAYDKHTSSDESVSDDDDSDDESSPHEYACFACGDKCPSQGALDNHILKQHGARLKCQCQVCQGKKRSNAVMLMEEDTIKDGEKDVSIFRCLICNSVFFLGCKCLWHIEQKHDSIILKYPFECGNCSKMFEKNRLLFEHQQDAHDRLQKLSRCGYCRESFDETLDLEAHINESHQITKNSVTRTTKDYVNAKYEATNKQPKPKAAVTGVVSSSSGPVHQASKRYQVARKSTRESLPASSVTSTSGDLNPPEEFCCEICSKRSKSKTGYTNHMTVYHKIKPKDLPLVMASLIGETIPRKRRKVLSEDDSSDESWRPSRTKASSFPMRSSTRIALAASRKEALGYDHSHSSSDYAKDDIKRHRVKRKHADHQTADQHLGQIADQQQHQTADQQLSQIADQQQHQIADQQCLTADQQRLTADRESCNQSSTSRGMPESDTGRHDSDLDSQESDSDKHNFDSENYSSHSEKETSGSEKKNLDSEKEKSDSEKEKFDNEIQNSETDKGNSDIEKQNSQSEKKNSDIEKQISLSEMKNSGFEKQNSQSEKTNSDNEKQNSESENKNADNEKQNSEFKKDYSGFEKQNSDLTKYMYDTEKQASACEGQVSDQEEHNFYQEKQAVDDLKQDSDEEKMYFEHRDSAEDDGDDEEEEEEEEEAAYSRSSQILQMFMENKNDNCKNCPACKQEAAQAAARAARFGRALQQSDIVCKQEPKDHSMNIRVEPPPIIIRDVYSLNETATRHSMQCSNDMSSMGNPPLPLPITTGTSSTHVRAAHNLPLPMSNPVIAPLGSSCISCLKPIDHSQCVHCGIVFLDEVMHIIHMGWHSRNNPFDCHACGKKCRDKFSFITHIFRDPHL